MIFKLAILFTLNLMFNIYVYAESKISFVHKEILFAKWGEGPGEFKFNDNSKYGPAQFVFDSTGNIIIPWSNKVYKFDKNGKYLLNFENKRYELSGFIPDYASFGFIDDNDNIYVHSGAKREKISDKFKQYIVNKFDPQGNFMETIYLPGQENITYAQMTYDGDIYYDNGTIISQLKLKEDNFKKTKLRFMQIISKRISDFEDKIAKIEITGLSKIGGKSDKITFEVPNFSSRYLLYAPVHKIDKEKNIYLLLERLNPRNKSRTFLEILVLSKNGEELNIVKCHYSTYLQRADVEAPILIDDDGNIYQLWNDSKGIHISKWQLKK